MIRIRLSMKLNDGRNVCDGESRCPSTQFMLPVTADAAARDRQRFVFVRDGFHFWALLLGPLWLLWHRLWLALLG